MLYFKYEFVSLLYVNTEMEEDGGISLEITLLLPDIL